MFFFDNYIVSERNIHVFYFTLNLKGVCKSITHTKNYTTKMIYHSLINAMLIQEGLKLQINIPHELYFIESFFEYDSIYKDKDLLRLFLIFCKQYYNSYNFIKPMYEGNLVSALIAHKNFFRDKFFRKYVYQENINVETINKAFKFGSMISDFMIRYLGFSLIKCSGENIIITASLYPLKRFEELLSQGYSLENRSKIYYKNGLFYKLPVLPTSKNDYIYEEIIETSENKFERILR